MPNPTAPATPLREQLDRLASFEPSDDAATYWRVSETALSYKLGTRVVGAFGLLNSYCLKTLSNARITPIAHIGRERGVG